MTIVRCFEMLIPTRFRERVRIWLASRITVPVQSYFDVRQDLIERSELLFQTLEQRVVRGEQQMSDRFRAELAECRDRVTRLERKLAELESSRGTGSSSTATPVAAPSSDL
jgi:predicted RNase H-like nuclease (RuvC/YqgF family)